MIELAMRLTKFIEKHLIMRFMQFIQIRIGLIIKCKTDTL